MKRRLGLGTATMVSLGLIATLLAGCGGGAAPAPSRPAAATPAANGAATPAATPAGGKGSGPPATLPTVKTVVLVGTQIFPMEVMQQQGFDRQHGFQVKLTKSTGPQGVYTIMQTGAYDVAFGGWPSIALFISKGLPVTNVYSVYGYTDEALVKQGSTIQSFADLKGKRIGIFGGPSASSTWMFYLECKRFFGFDPQTQAHVEFGAPGLLMGEIAKGQLDAVVILDPFIEQMLAGGYRSVGNLGAIWQQHFHQTPLLVAVDYNTKWAGANPKLAKAFLAAFIESMDYIKAHPGIWTELAKTVNITDPATVKLLRQRVTAGYVMRWDAAFFKQQEAFGTILYDAYGQQTGFPKTVPAGTFSTAYLPAGGGA